MDDYLAQNGDRFEAAVKAGKTSGFRNIEDCCSS
jgi:hypothetical protein